MYETSSFFIKQRKKLFPKAAQNVRPFFADILKYKAIVHNNESNEQTLQE